MVTPWAAQSLFPSPISAIWEKVGRKEGTGPHPLEKGDLWVRLKSGHCSLIPLRIHSRRGGSGTGCKVGGTGRCPCPCYVSPASFHLSWGLACPLCNCTTQGHAHALTHSTHAGVGAPKGAGWWGGPGVLGPSLGFFNTRLFSPLQPPKPSDLSIVCFTSGTTGKWRH